MILQSIHTLIEILEADSSVFISYGASAGGKGKNWN